jgi:hypothetical protein
MPDDHMRQTINRAQNEVLRTRILRITEARFPEWILKDVLFRTLENSHVDTSLNDLDFNVHYLAEKGLLKVETEGKKTNAAWRVKLTARGIDYLEGRLEEIGLASPDLIE